MQYLSCVRPLELFSHVCGAHIESSLVKRIYRIFAFLQRTESGCPNALELICIILKPRWGVVVQSRVCESVCYSYLTRDICFLRWCRSETGSIPFLNWDIYTLLLVSFILLVTSCIYARNVRNQISKKFNSWQFSELAVRFVILGLLFFGVGLQFLTNSWFWLSAFFPDWICIFNILCPQWTLLVYSLWQLTHFHSDNFLENF